jgi:hypothetical protein
MRFGGLNEIEAKCSSMSDRKDIFSLRHLSFKGNL